MSKATVEISGLTKAFGANRVLRGIDLELHKGEVTVLMGANGAGKSTLVKVICGVHSADSGAIKLDGVLLRAQTPYDAIHAGVVTVHQSINDGVIPDLDVASNLMLDKLAEPGSGFFLKGREIRRPAQDVARSMGLNVDVTRPVSALDLADRQLVAIARAMTHEPRLLILDEPTSSLSATEASRLFALIDRLRDAGVAILYISHRTSDIRRIADRIVCMRDGEIVGRFLDKPLDYNAAVNAMLGHGLTDVDLDFTPAGAAVLGLDQLQISPTSKPISLTVYEDEVVAVTGLVGRWLSEPSKLLILDEPFQGVDIKARRDIGDKIRETAKGRATVVMASEMDEVLEIADRIVVLVDQSVAGDHNNRDLNLKTVMAQVAGQYTPGATTPPAHEI